MYIGAPGEKIELAALYPFPYEGLARMNRENRAAERDIRDMLFDLCISAIENGFLLSCSIVRFALLSASMLCDEQCLIVKDKLHIRLEISNTSPTILSMRTVGRCNVRQEKRLKIKKYIVYSIVCSP